MKKSAFIIFVILILFLNVNFIVIAYEKNVKNSIVPDYVQRGDIVFMDSTDYDSIWAIPGYSNDHAAIYLGHDYEDGSYFINACGQGITIVNYDFFNSFLENFTYYRVINANNSLIEQAIKWAEDRLGAKYQCFFPQLFNPKWWYIGMFELGEKCADPKNKTIKTAGRFYCSELVWASYYNQGIDIDQNGWEEVKPVPSNGIPKFFRRIWERYGWAFTYVDCDDIINSNETVELLPD